MCWAAGARDFPGLQESIDLKCKAVGFYWTLPVPWAGFDTLPDKIEEAAKASRTIAFQRALIHRFAASEGYEIVHEAAFLEVEPDRGSEFIQGALEKAATECREHGAILLFVDFSGAQGWRSHAPMMQWLRDAEIEALPIEATEMVIGGQAFDPHEHFAEWRSRQREWSENKNERRAEALARAFALQQEGLSHPTIATRLNQEGVRSLSGKPWTGEGLRKFLKGS
jgi:hypothetical protein